MVPRPYQTEAIANCIAELNDHGSTLMVLPTGCGKTICFAKIAEEYRDKGRIMVIAHRRELIEQAVDKIHKATTLRCDREMAEDYSYTGQIFQRSDVVVSSVQTQNAGMDGRGRMNRFDPQQFSLLIIDEAHHAVAKSYLKVIDHYRKNPELKVLGVTATPDRKDEAALGRVFKTAGYVYEINDAIEDGWLVPIQVKRVMVNSLDFRDVKTTAGDFNQSDLDRVMRYEKVLHGVALPTMQLAKGKRTLVFAASVAHAERLCEIFNRYEPGSADWVVGTTASEQRALTFKAFADGRIRILVNVGVATEGFDDPGIEAVVIARPTKSRALYAQMIGRGTRPLPHVVDGRETSTIRKNSIKMSAKTCLTVLDFAGNSGHHKLITAADILGGKYEDRVVARAKKIAEKRGDTAGDVLEDLDEAEQQLRKEAEERAREMERQSRNRILGVADYRVITNDPFDVLDITPWRQKGWDRGRPATEKQVSVIRKAGLDVPDNLNIGQAKQLVTEIFQRWKNKRSTVKQIKLLAKYGYDATHMKQKMASKLIDAIAKNGWRPLDELPADLVD